MIAARNCHFVNRLGVVAARPFANSSRPRRQKMASKQELMAAGNDNSSNVLGSNGPSSSATPDAKMAEAAPTTTVPLKMVVTEAVKRWFDDTLQEATKGDIKQQALLSQMYAEGYGCEKNPKAAKEWADRAKSRGYMMKGVYCEL